MDRRGEVADNRGLWDDLHGRTGDGAARAAWADDRLRWGLFGVPEAHLEALGEVSGRDVLEVGCGTGATAARLVRRGARVVATDLTAPALRMVRARQADEGPRFAVLQVDAEHLPFGPGRFDLVLSEHAAAAWCAPDAWVAEAARVLRPDGRLVFLTNSVLSALCVPEGAGVAGERLLRGQRDVRRVHWDGGGVEFHPSHGEWLGVLRRHGFVVEALHELYAPAGSAPDPAYEIVTADWAARWPAEELWVATLAEPTDRYARKPRRTGP